jgi:hypothetical protein
MEDMTELRIMVIAPPDRPAPRPGE